MKKETRGRKPISIIESIPYSQIIFLIASGINYPEAISKARNTDSSSSVKQLEELRKARFLNEPRKEKLLNKTIYSVNWEKINEEFANFILSSALKKRQQLQAYFGDKYKDYIERQEKDLTEYEKDRVKFKLKEEEKKKQNEEEIYKKYEKLIESKRLNKNKYLKLLFEKLFADYYKVYVKNNIPLTIKEVFEEAKQSFGFENFSQYIWTRMLDVVLYQADFPHNLLLNNSKEYYKRREQKLKELTKRYDSLRNKDFEDLISLELVLRFCFWGYLVPNANYQLAQEIIKEKKLITEEEFEEYKQAKAKAFSKKEIIEREIDKQNDKNPEEDTNHSNPNQPQGEQAK